VLTAIDIFLALLIGILLVRLGRRLNPSLKSFWLALELFLLLCFLSDWGLLAALPLLQRSFGQVALSLFLITGFRLVLFAPAFFLLQWHPLRRNIVVMLVVVGLFQAALFAGEVDAFYIEPFHLTVTELPIQTPAFFPDRPLRVLQISDLHVERITQRERDVLAQAESLQPDIIVLTGDYVNSSYENDPLTLQETRQLLSKLRAPSGIYAVNGNTDKLSVMSALFDGLANIRLLYDEVLPIHFPGGTLYIVGLKLGSDRVRDSRVLQYLAGNLPPGAFSLLIYHTPEMIETAASSGVDLYLAGHTHGGQIRLPFYGAILPRTGYSKIYEMGEYRVGSTTLYVSRGIGMGGGLSPRVRFLCPPELVLVELGK
jgi:predicted MPP superfamily phosphohydrolase